MIDSNQVGQTGDNDETDEGRRLNCRVELVLRLRIQLGKKGEKRNVKRNY